MTYHGSYKSWHYSALDQINTSNVGKLQEAWSHAASRANRGLQSFPLAVDGVVYYSSPYNQVYALDGATGEVLWTYKQKLNEDLVAKQTHSPYNRGIAAGYGNIYMGTLDGKLVAIDMKTGKLNWETKLINSEKLTVGFTGAPLLVKDKVIIGSQGGEWPYRGPIFGVDAKTGDAGMAVLHRRRQRRHDGGCAQHLGQRLLEDRRRRRLDGRRLRPRDQHGVVGYRQPGTAVRLGRRQVEDRRSASRHQSVHDFGHAARSRHRQAEGLSTRNCRMTPGTSTPRMGEFVMLEHGGKKYIVHPNKGGFVFVYDRTGKVQNVYAASRTSTS